MKREAALMLRSLICKSRCCFLEKKPSVKPEAKAKFLQRGAGDEKAPHAGGGSGGERAEPGRRVVRRLKPCKPALLKAVRKQVTMRP